MHDLPTQIGRYRVLGLLGTGGMAEVFLAKLVGPRGFERPVVIKRILPHLAREQHFRDMFLDEARIVSGIQHQNVVHVQELCQEDGDLFMVMEYLEGESAAGLARRLSAKRKLLSFGLAAHVVGDICNGLHAAHNLKDSAGRIQNLVHRDVSPANIFITYDGGVKVLDFGIAVASNRVSRTEAGQVKGKYAYMSPEQCKGKPLDRRSDVFSLGTVLYEISTCRRLFKRDSDMLTLQAICSEGVVAPSKLVTNYPASLEAVIMKALAKRREDRYQSALDMRRDLLEVSRELNGDKIPEESLARVMHKLFVDRIEQKHSLLSRIRAGNDVTTVPAAEVDSSVELPAAGFSEDLQSSSAVSIHSTSLAVARSRPKAIYGIVAAALVMGVGLFAGGLAWEQHSAAQAAHAAADAAQAPAPPNAPTPAEPAIPPAPPAEPDKVSVALESQPPGARVYLNGRPRGETPVRLNLERSSKPLELAVKLDGYVPHSERVTPDVDQKLRLVMLKSPAPVAAPPPSGPVMRKAPVKARPAPPPKAEPTPAEDPYKRFN